MVRITSQQAQDIFMELSEYVDDIDGPILVLIAIPDKVIVVCSKMMEIRDAQKIRNASRISIDKTLSSGN